MIPERWQRLQQLFEQALNLDHDARRGFLARECADDSALAGEVFELLQAHDRESRLERRIEDDIGSTLYAPDLAAGQVVGRFKVTQLLGRGGMGTVYLAERADDEFRQKVALKIVSQGPLHGELPLRFRAERQILALLNHPNIARLIDGGQMADGTPYIVMEYVEGVRIDRYCDQHQLSTHARLRLIQQVCAAVSYAHQHLIIHRDLKPANILVTQEGVPKLLDFGIAKLLDAQQGAATGAPVTRFRDRVMTPEHASPEQLRGEPVGTASDVYSLGVLIYELLAGRHPYRLEKNSLYEIERVIREQTVPAPSTSVLAQAAATGSAQLRVRARELEGDLDNIVLKAMSHQVERRYASVVLLAQDIQNYIEQRPVQARPDTWAYRTRRFARRNAIAVTSAVSAVLLIVTFTVYYTFRITAERDAAERERQIAVRVSEFMINAFKLANPNELPGSEVSAQAVLDAAAKQVGEDFADEPRVRLASMRMIVGTYMGMGLVERAHALALETVAATRDEARVSRLDLARALHLLGNAEFVKNLQAEAERSYEEARSIRVAMKQQGTEEGIRLLTDLANVRLEKRQIAEALQVLGQAEEFAEALAPPQPKSLGYIHLQYAAIYLAAGDYKKAEDYARRALLALKGVVYEGIDQYAIALNILGDSLYRQLRTSEAEVAVRDLMDWQLRRYGPDHILIGHAWNNYARVLMVQGKYPAAEQALLESLRIARRDPEVGRVAISVGLMNLGELYYLAGEPRKAIAQLDASLDLWRQVKGDYSTRVVGALIQKSAALRDLGELPAAQATFHEAETLANEKFEPDDPYHGLVLKERGALWLAHREFDRAQRDLQQAKDLLNQRDRLDRVADTGVDLGEAALRSNQLERARAEFSGALEIRRKILPAGHWAIADAQSRLGHVLFLSGDRERGERMMSEALQDLRAIRPAADVTLLGAERRLQSVTASDAAMAH